MSFTNKMRIDYQDGACPPFGPIYGLSEPKLDVLRAYIDGNLAKGSFVTQNLRPEHQSSSSRKMMAPCIYVSTTEDLTR